MGIADICEAFQQGLGSRGACTGATMGYDAGGARQVLRLQTSDAQGSVVIEAECPADGDILAVARAAGENWMPRKGPAT